MRCPSCSIVPYRGLRPGAILLWLAGLLSSMPVLAHDANVYGVLSRDSLPYREAARGMSEVVAPTGSHVRILTIGEAGFAAGQAPVPPGTVVAFGQRAANAFAPAQWPSQVACMVLEAGGKSAVLLQHPAEARLQRLRRLLPNAATVGVLAAEGETGSAEIRDIQRGARQLGMSVLVHPVDLRRPIAEQLEGLADRVDVLMATYDLRIYSAEHAPAVLLFSWRNRIPVIGASDAWTRAGAILSFDWDYPDLGRQCAELAIRMPAGRGLERPVLESPRRMPHSVNLEAARYFMLTIPADLQQAARNRY